MFFQRKFLSVCISLIILFISMEAFPSQDRKEIKIETIEAETISNDLNGNLVLEGNVIITTNLLSFSSTKALFNESEGLLELIGKVEVISDNLKNKFIRNKNKFKSPNFFSENS